MIFIFGGAYQGMEEYAREMYGVREIITADESTAIDFSTGAVNGMDKFALGCVRRGESACERIEQMRGQWESAVIIGLDFSCGLVPMDAEQRAWREENGRLNSWLAQHSDHTIRMFCGLPQVLK